MSFYHTQTKEQQDNYKIYLGLVCSLSRLFSNSSSPYLYYRVAENIFCKAFGADNLSRSDCSADARKDKLGIGLKTFLHGNGRTFQKIAEFNSDRKKYAQHLEKPEKFIHHIAQLRNERIKFTQRTYGIENMIYHCVTRKNKELEFHEMPMNLIDINSVNLLNANKTSIAFKDKHDEYTFNISKSTLLKRFVTNQNITSIPIDIVEDPIKLLLNLRSFTFATTQEFQKNIFIMLPLYSSNKAKEKIVSQKSGLNQWNAQGRARNYNEIYIQIPSWIHRVFEDFFPKRDRDFTLVLPNKKQISAKVCQDNSKALMSNPNKALGEWLLRDVLGLEEGELLNYEKLDSLGIDSVRIDKLDSNTYAINFAKIGSFDLFEENNKD